MEITNRLNARRTGVKLTFALVAAAAIAIPIWRSRGTSRTRGGQPVEATLDRPALHGPALDGPALDGPALDGPSPVQANRGDDVVDGFLGDIHPQLHGKTNLEVTAHWTALGQGRDQLEKRIPASVYSLFTNLRPTTPSQIYTERDFSAFMPESVESVGQVWEIGRDDVAQFLRQFHPRPSLHLVARGRRAGPDGAFGLLRAISSTHLDIVFRIHAEFDLAQNVWLTPACFRGRMIIDRQAGTVEYFRLWVPTDKPLNIHLTVSESMPQGGTEFVLSREIKRGDLARNRRDIVHVEQMELVGANGSLPETLDWPDSIDMNLAERKLKTAFYVFENINWVPWERAVTVARESHKPILAIVLWGALDDQSC